MTKRPIMCQSKEAVHVPECDPDLEARVEALEECCFEAEQKFIEHDARITANEEAIVTINDSIIDLEGRVTSNETAIAGLETTKQDKIVAGDNITIDGNTISAIPSEYIAGDNIDIDGNNVISTPSYTGVGNISVSNAKEISVDLSDYYTSGRVYTKQEVDDLIGQGFEFVPVDTLPTTGQSSKIYLLATSDPNVRDMYVYNGGTWKKVGSTGVSLSGVVKTTGARETYDEHRITAWLPDSTIRRLQILGIGWEAANTITSNDGYGSGSPGADTGGSVTP